MRRARRSNQVSHHSKNSSPPSASHCLLTSWIAVNQKERLSPPDEAPVFLQATATCVERALREAMVFRSKGSLAACWEQIVHPGGKADVRAREYGVLQRIV